MRFLIIDDDMFKIDILKEFIGKEDIDVSNSFVDGLQKTLENKYDGIFLDMNFPHYDNGPVRSHKGIELIERLEFEDNNTPICIFSSQYVDTSKYSNVKDQIVFDGCSDLRLYIKEFKDAVSNTNKCEVL